MGAMERSGGISYGVDGQGDLTLFPLFGLPNYVDN